MGTVPPEPTPRIALRPIVRADLPTLFQQQLDPDSNRLAVTRPRDAETFFPHWEKVLLDPAVVPRVITADDRVIGSISRFERDGRPYVGYWIDKAHWGKGIATRAIALLVAEVSTRPLHARVASSNVASLRALLRNGFVVTEVRRSEETERFPACEETLLVLER